MTRKTLNDLPSSPTPKELYAALTTRPGWKYKSCLSAQLQQRDRALVALLYVAELRVSEAIRLTKDQFKQNTKAHEILVENIRLSKRKKGKAAMREARLPTRGERACFTKLIIEYMDTLQDKARLFPWSLTERVYDTGHTYTVKGGEVKPILSTQVMGTKRAWQIVNAYFPEYTEHWLRAFGEDYLYSNMNHDLMAVANEVGVDARTLQEYLKKQHKKYAAV